MKFIHTSDWQIGMRAAHAGAKGAAVREERLAAARRVVKLAGEQGAQFILVAGDTFEDNAVDRLLVQKVADILAAFGGPVFILPGNHDPLVAGSVWEHASWGSHANLHIIRDCAAIAIPGGTLFPCPLKSKFGNSDPTMWIDGNRGDAQGIRIGMAHGTVEGIASEEPYFPIPRDAAKRCGLDYLALGHWHSYATIGDGIVYSGTHETTKFGERDSGNALLVEIDEPGAAPRITPLRTGRLRWHQWPEVCANDGDLQRLLEKLTAIEEPDAALLDLTVSGVFMPVEQPVLARLREIGEARLLHLRIDDVGLRPSPTDLSWLDRLPAGAVRQAAEKLNGWSQATSVDRPADVSAATASRALLELFVLSSSAGAGEAAR